jgi:hypothetical protein
MKMRLVFALAAVLGAVRAASAVDFFELEVYPATTEGKGLHELESLNSFVANGRRPSDEELEGEEARRHRLFRTSLEYNYGLTDKIDVAAYVNVQHENGDELEYAGSKFRVRGALWDKGRYPVDLGWYVEAEMPYGEESDLEFEFRPILSRDFGRFSLDLNPIFELPTVTSERRTLEFDYAARVYYRLSRDWQPGLEFYGGAGQIRRFDPSREQEHYVLPAIYGRVIPGLKFAFGPAFGITRASDPVIVRLNVEYEFTFPFGGGVSSPSNTPVTY